ncbi:DoxX family protein [Chitinophaga silvatica]|uniref:DoxX family protein n=1 Tax=Chitinophaga silvatica TaxID=2282649 RepID=A0A3E1Y2E6_9BACT|nr:DoxX family protein [Chitinophaga silvatica]RFS18823.1 DoxX family protein [Chitinophaga silvatica]
METPNVYLNKKPSSKGAFITGWVISGLCILFLLFDAIMKIILNHYSVEGSVQLGWPAEHIQGLGITLLIATILYAIPRTAVLGGVLICCYLGGAVAIMVRVNAPFYFPIIMGILIWVSLYLRIPAIKSIFPFVKN